MAVEPLESLVGKAQSGDIQAFAEVVRRFRDMACGYAYSILDDSHLAQDAAQEAFVDAYAKLKDLREPAAFPGWFRRIVFKHCDRMTRGNRPQHVSLDSVAEVASREHGPDTLAEKRDMTRRVLAALQELSEKERTATTLFYMNGYSQAEVAEFLDVPVNTVKARLHSARAKLRERMVDMVAETLKEMAPDERFSRDVIGRLLSGPNLLNVEGHPVRELWEALRLALADFTVVPPQEVISSESPVNPWTAERYSYHPSEREMLCTDVMDASFREMGRRKSPLRIITAGRAFNHNDPYVDNVPVTHQVSVFCVEPEAGRDSMEGTVKRIAMAVLGALEVKYDQQWFHWFEPCLNAHVKLGDDWHRLAGCGVMTEQTLRHLGHDPSQVGGYGVTFRLETVVKIKTGIADIHELWQPPYLPSGAGPSRS
jgi:RNA polymerase sigma factor (sigma-70 family)